MSEVNATPAPEQDIRKEIESSIESIVEKKLDERAVKISKAPTVPAVAKEDDWSFGEWLSLIGKMACKTADHEGVWNILVNKYQIKSTLNQTTNTAGGYTVPNRWEADLLRLDDYPTVAYDRVRKFDAPGYATLYVPVLDQTATPSAGNDPFLGGMAVAVVAEGSAPAANTQPAFKQLALTPKKYLATAQITRELLDNSILNVAQIVTDLCREMVMNRVEYSVLNGGDANFTGIIGHASTIDVKRNTAAHFKLADAANMVKRLAPSATRTACWVVHPYVFGELLQLQDSSGRVVWIANAEGYPSATGAPVLYLFGLPVYTSQFLPALGQTGDVLLVDFGKNYSLAINKDIVIQPSEHFAFNQDLITYRVAMRLAGSPNYSNPVTLQDGTSTVAAAVQLDTSTS